MLRARYRRIMVFWARVLLSLILWELILPRLGMRGWSQRTRSERLRRTAAQFRALAIQMGGVLIKVGQFLSSRVDVLPMEVVTELAGLQDEVPAEQFDDIRRVAEQEFGMPLSERFAGFDETPMAAASLGQVHRAQLAPQSADGLSPTNVVVKIQRPDIENLIATDLAALRTVGKWLQHYPPIRKRMNVSALLGEFTRTLYEEIDYLAEGRNAETFAANFKQDAGVRVPQVVWTHTTQRVLTLEDVGAIKITDYDAITAAGIDRAEVAKRLLDTYLKQIFEDGFFHADPHPGNLFISPLSHEMGEGGGGGEGCTGWTLTFVDFGMVGRVSPGVRAGLREMVIAVGLRDVARMTQSYKMLGVLLPGADTKLLEEAAVQVFERFWGKSMAELTQISLSEVYEFAREFSGVIYSMPFQVPQDLIFLGRAVGILSGMCTGLDPEFNVFEHLVPYAQKLITQEAVSGWRSWVQEAETIALKMLALPGRTEALLSKIERGDLSVSDPRMTETMRRMERSTRRLGGALVFAALLLGGIQLYLGGVTTFGTILMVMAGLTLVWVAFSRR